MVTSIPRPANAPSTTETTEQQNNPMMIQFSTITRISPLLLQGPRTDMQPTLNMIEQMAQNLNGTKA